MTQENGGSSIPSANLSYENLGKSTKTATVKYYISTNDYISKWDTYIGSRTMTLERSQPLRPSPKMEVQRPEPPRGGALTRRGSRLDASSAP